MTPILSIIIAHRNEPEHLEATVRSIRETSEKGWVEIIVIDDYSDSPPDPVKLDSNLGLMRTDWGKWPIEPSNIRIFRSPTRQGHACQRQFGASVASGQWLMFTDAHMSFEIGWFEAFVKHVQEADHSQTLFCGPYIACRDSEHNIEATYWGARFKFYAPFGEPGQIEILTNTALSDRPEFEPGRENDPFEAPSIIGANYFLQADWFKTIGGLNGFVHWTGTDEWMLSVKTWLCGGRVLVLPDVRVRHILYKTGHGQTGYGKEMNKGQLLFNKLSAAYQVFPPELFENFMECLPVNHCGDVMQTALQMLQERQEQLDYWRRKTQSAFKHDIDWLVDKFGINHPLDIGAMVSGVVA